VVPYLISVLAAAADVVVLLTVLVRLRGQVRRLSDTVRRGRAHFAQRIETLVARIAALRVALTQRRRRNRGGSSSVPAA
jgi:hypothetical protein